MTVRASYPIMTLFVALAALPLATASPYHRPYRVRPDLRHSRAGTNLIMGTAGQASFAHAAFFGLGAYTTAVLSTKFDFPVWLTLPIALCLSFVVGSLLAYPALRCAVSIWRWLRSRSAKSLRPCRRDAGRAGRNRRDQRNSAIHSRADGAPTTG